MSEASEASPVTRIIANSAVQIVGTVMASLVSLFTFAAITRALGPTSFGYYSAALALLLIPNIVSDLGLSTTVLRDISKRPELTSRVVSASLTARTFVAVVAYSLALGLMFVVPLPHQARIAALVGTAGSFLLVLNAGLLPALQAELRMQWAVLANVAGRALTLGLTLGVLWAGGGLYAVVLAYAAGNALTLLIDFIVVQHRYVLRPVTDLHYCWHVGRASLLVGAALMMGSLYFRIDTVLLAVFRPAAEVGLYSAAYKFFDLSLLVVAAVAVSVFPHLTRVIFSGESGTADVQYLFDVLLALGSGIAVVALVHADHLVVLASGSKYGAAAPVLRILAPAIAIVFIGAVFERVLLAGHRERLLLLVSVVVFVLNVTLNLILLPRYGYKAAAATTLASEFVWVGFAAAAVRRSFGFTPSVSFVPQVAVATGITAALLVFMPGPWPLVEAGGAFAYVLVLALLPGPGWHYILAILPPTMRRHDLLDDRGSTTT